MIKRILVLSFFAIKVIILIHFPPIHAGDEMPLPPKMKFLQGHYELIRPLEGSHDELYKLLVTKRDIANHYVGVKTTGIACRFGCPAKPPLQENCLFSNKLHDLIGQGLRECKVCKPLSYNSPEDLRGYLESVERAEFPSKSPISIPAKASAWVKKAHNADLLKYICTKRSNNVLKNLHLSTVKAITGTLTYCRYWTPVGSMVACFSATGLCLLEFSDRRMLESELLGLQKKHKAVFRLKSNTLSHQLEEELREYFNGTRQKFSIPLDQRGSDFQISVWQALKNIPYGTTTSYKKQALLLGRPDAIRAVANANGSNSISILVPCHRVIGESGELMGYGGGLERKKFLLDLERLTTEKHENASTALDFQPSIKKRGREEALPEDKMKLTRRTLART